MPSRASKDGASIASPSLATQSLIPEARRTFQLALPIIIGNLAGLGISVVDTLMAGRLGATALGAVSLGSAVWASMYLFVLGTSMALPPAVAQLDGAGDRRGAGNTARQALWLAAALAALAFLGCRNAFHLLGWVGVDHKLIPLASGYLQALSWGVPAVCGTLMLRFFSEGTGQTRPTMYVGFLGALVNIPANFWFIYGGLGVPALGAVGVGWASALVFWVQFLAWLWWVSRHPGYRPYRLFRRWEGPRWSEISELLRVGLPIGGMVAIEGSLFVAAALLIGRLGEIAVAAHQIAINFASLVFMVPLGLGNAISVRVGNAIGRREPQAARFQGFLGMAMAMVLQTVGVLAMILLPAPIIALYTNDQQVAGIAAQLLFLAAIFQYPDSLQVTAAGALRGLKDTRIPMIYTIIAYWLVGMTLGYQLTFNYAWGASGMWAGLIAGLSVAAILLTARFARSSKRLILSTLPAQAVLDGGDKSKS